MVKSHSVVRIISKAYIVDYLDRWRVHICLREGKPLNNGSILILAPAATSAQVEGREPALLQAAGPWGFAYFMFCCLLYIS